MWQSTEDFKGIRLPCGRMIRLLAHPFPPLPSGSCFPFSCVSPGELTDARGGKGREKSLIIRPQESLALNESFNRYSFMRKTKSEGK